MTSPKGFGMISRFMYESNIYINEIINNLKNSIFFTSLYVFKM